MRDEKILVFLWKFKIATSRMVFERFFAHKSPETAYKMLRRLISAELIQYYSGSFADQFAITLTRKGFDLIRPRLPKLKENGFKTEAPSHDLLSTAVLLGDWISEPPPGLEIFTEQQFRRFKRENHPSWVPNCAEHRPDGIWKIRNGHSDKVIALEVELSPKTNVEYRAIGMYYREHKSVKRIHWLVPSKAIGRRINEHLAHPASTGNTQHNFILVEDYIQNEWNSRIFLGPDMPHPLSHFMVTCLPHGYPPWEHKVTLDLSKKPFISKSWKQFDYVAFCR